MNKLNNINKKQLSIIIIMILLFSITSYAKDTSTYDEVNCNKIESLLQDEILISDKILIKNPNDEIRNLLKNNNDKIKTLLENGKIIILDKTNNPTLDLSNDLGFPLVIVNNNEKSMHNLLNQDATKTISTLYYYDNEGIPVIHDIEVLSKTAQTTYDKIISDTADEVLSKKNTYKDRSYKAHSLSTDQEPIYIGRYEKEYRNYDIALLEMTYKFYTLENFEGEDFYTCIGNINANPGRAMCDLGYDDYDYDIQGDRLDVEIMSDISEFEREEYGPHRTAGSSSYSFSLGASWSSKGITIPASFSYSQSISDTDINVNSSPRNTKWSVDLKHDAEKQTCTFSPAITYKGDENEPFMKFWIEATFYTDAWNEHVTQTGYGKNFICYPDRLKDSDL